MPNYQLRPEQMRGFHVASPVRLTDQVPAAANGQNDRSSTKLRSEIFKLRRN